MTDINDFMRYNLVTKFVCSDCGEQLALSYKIPKEVYSSEKSDDITGAGKVEQRIAIHPCEACYGKAKRPIETLRQALNQIIQEEQ